MRTKRIETARSATIEAFTDCICDGSYQLTDTVHLINRDTLRTMIKNGDDVFNTSNIDTNELFFLVDTNSKTVKVVYEDDLEDLNDIMELMEIGFEQRANAAQDESKITPVQVLELTGRSGQPRKLVVYRCDAVDSDTYEKIKAIGDNTYPDSSIVVISCNIRFDVVNDGKMVNIIYSGYEPFDRVVDGSHELVMHLKRHFDNIDFNFVAEKRNLH